MLVSIMFAAEAVDVIRHLRKPRAEAVDHVFDLLEQLLVRRRCLFKSAARLFDAPRKLVFQVFTEPEHVARWWPPFGFTIPICTIDFRPDGVMCSLELSL